MTMVSAARAMICLALRKYATIIRKQYKAGVKLATICTGFSLTMKRANYMADCFKGRRQWNDEENTALFKMG